MSYLTALSVAVCVGGNCCTRSIDCRFGNGTVHLVVSISNSNSVRIPHGLAVAYCIIHIGGGIAVSVGNG